MNEADKLFRDYSLSRRNNAPKVFKIVETILETCDLIDMVWATSQEPVGLTTAQLRQIVVNVISDGDGEKGAML